MTNIISAVLTMLMVMISRTDMIMMMEMLLLMVMVMIVMIRYPLQERQNIQEAHTGVRRLAKQGDFFLNSRNVNFSISR